MTMCFGKHVRNFGMWTALAVGITAASMSASKKQDVQHHTAKADTVRPRVSLTLPLN
ncbi:hypothetical protein OVA07_05245 [Novosphingobium sp. SL115]|uniref:hypothetical protein n=1 Tax=Novosphingobium sp. SL115 TaxID=2995150 RepID=UPI00227552DB|nr:hypothetical protein [Novosphingobium sp. SL115]MCY1670415.1 hypothetical protein [Novosphingobium sp. SL115]